MSVYLVYEHNSSADYPFLDQVFIDHHLAEDIAKHYTTKNNSYEVIELAVKGDNSMTAFETIGNVKMDELTNDELNAIIKNLMNEQKQRKENKQIEEWKKLTKAMLDYIYHYGEISVDLSNDDYIAIDTMNDFSTPGEIHVN